jgi:hypothetical protein
MNMNHENQRQDPLSIACFISPHGFGHAARASATIEAVGTRLAPCHFEIFTTVPSWFFADSLSVPFSWHSVTTDIGLVDFISRQMSGIALSEADFGSGRWLAILPKLLELPRQPREVSNGSEQIAHYICKVLENRNITRKTIPKNLETQPHRGEKY